MQARNRRSHYRLILALGIALPGLIGILVVQAKAVASESMIVQSALQTDSTVTPTPSLFQVTLPLPSLTSTSIPENSLPTSSSVLPSGLYAFIQVPSGPVERPYVVLVAFASTPRTISTTIKGLLNSQEFICPRSPCAVGLQTSSRLVFAAYGDSGESSETVIASVSVTSTVNGYLVTIDSVSQFNIFSNSCSNAWGVSDTENVTWDDFVQFAYEIHTKKTLHTLATHLLLSGIVDASSCPFGGLSTGLDWPTACGLERASQKMIEWQNQFD